MPEVQLDIEDAIEVDSRRGRAGLGLLLHVIRWDRSTDWVGGKPPADRHYWDKPPSLRVVALAIGISHAKLSRVESSKTELSVQEFARLCRFYRLSDERVLDLLGRS